MKRNKKIIQYGLSAFGVFLFAVCFSVLSLQNGGKSAKTLKQNKELDSIPLDVHVDLQEENQIALSNVGIKLSREKDGTREYAIIDSTENGYQVDSWTTSEQSATQVPTDELGNVRFNNLTEGNYTIYQSESRESQANFISPVDIQIVRNQEQQLVAMNEELDTIPVNTNSGVTTIDLTSNQNMRQSTCYSTCAKLSITKSVWPPTEEDWSYDFNVTILPGSTVSSLQLNLPSGYKIEDSFTLSNDKNKDDDEHPDVQKYDYTIQSFSFNGFAYRIEEINLDSSKYHVSFYEKNNLLQKGNRLDRQCKYNDECAIHVVNWLDGMGDLLIKKDVREEYCGSSSPDCDEHKKFTVIVRITPEDGTTLKDKYSYYISSNPSILLSEDEYDQIQTLTFETEGDSKVATLMLEKGQYARIMGLPANTSYEVTEKIDESKYYLLTKNETGKILSGDEVLVNLLNIQNVSTYMQEFHVKKRWVDDDLTHHGNSSVTFLIKDKEGNIIDSKTVDEESDWECTFVVPKKDIDDKDITYVLEEQEVPGYESVKDENVIVITNTIQDSYKKPATNPSTPNTRDYIIFYIVLFLIGLLLVGIVIRQKLCNLDK